MNLELSILNTILADLDDFRYKNKSKLKQTNVVKEIDGDGEQNESGLSFEVYPFPGIENLYVKLRITTDSYGDNEAVTGIEFVKPTEKVVTVYEKI